MKYTIIALILHIALLGINIYVDMFTYTLLIGSGIYGMFEAMNEPTKEKEENNNDC